jgi:Fic-DOC domain mobile mystery protein B
VIQSDEPDGVTLLEPAEREGLKQYWITTRGELNLAEQDNILTGMAWARRRLQREPQEVLDRDFMLALHKRMFGDVWRWAGGYRLTERNIGIEAFRIPEAVDLLLGDATYWVSNMIFMADEIAIRFHHRLAAIHPFPNGNGRHARLMADLLAQRLDRQPFSWGSGSLVEASALRADYIAALKAADGHDMSLLLAFARS